MWGFYIKYDVHPRYGNSTYFLWYFTDRGAHLNYRFFKGVVRYTKKKPPNCTTTLQVTTSRGINSFLNKLTGRGTVTRHQFLMPEHHFWIH